MKKLTWTSLFVSAAMLFTVGTGFASAEGNGTGHVDPEYTITIPYDYPVRPGTPEWAEFTDHQQMVDACEIPESILHSMTTEALVDTVLEYPLWFDPYLYDDINKGFSAMAEHFNGMVELMGRDGASDLLLERYQQTAVIHPNMMRSVEPDGYFYLSNIELMLAQESFYSQLNEEKQIVLTEEAETKYEERSQYPEDYGRRTRSVFYYALGQQQGISLFGAGDVINSYIVTTPRGSAVIVYDRQEYLNANDGIWEAQASNNLYPQATMIAYGTWKYNCHSYAWYNPSTSNRYWMNDPSKYWTDGSYATATAATGRIITYRSYNTLDHSGIITASSGGVVQQVRSKWGSSGLFGHAPTYCPYYYGGSAYGGTSLTYYTRQ